MKPLQHLTILDLSRALAGPFAGMILAELGAAVIKVEPPGAGDEARDGASYFACNRSKSSITVDLTQPEGQGIIRELAQKVDAVVEDFPAGTLARHGLDFAMLSALNPKLVYVSCTGQDRSGPAADLAPGLWVAIGILAMLAGRGKTGRGAHLDFSDFDGRVSLLALAAAGFFASGEMNGAAEILADPRVRARGLVGSFDYPQVGECKALGLPYRFLGWDNPAIGAPPTPGQDTERILADLLGMSAERIARLKAAKAI